MDTAPDYRAAAEAVAERYGCDSGFLIPMLQDVQSDFGYLPREALRRIGELLEVPLSQLYSVTTFYASFSLIPRGKHLITLCMGTVCYLKGAKEIAETLQEHLEIGPGETTRDGLFTFQAVNCLGACALAPVMLIDDQYFGKMEPDQVRGILADYAEKENPGGGSD